MQNSGKHWSGRGFKSNEKEVFLWHQSAPDMPAQSLLSLLSQECHKQPLKNLEVLGVLALILLGSLFVCMVKQTKFLEMAPTGSVPDFIVEFIPTGPLTPQETSPAPHMAGKGFPQTLEPPQTWKISNLCSLSLPPALTHHHGLLDTQSSPALRHQASVCWEKEIKQPEPTKNPWCNQTCQDLPGAAIP